MAGIYLHIPYCKQACNYCDFHFSTSLGSMSSMRDAMCNEILLRSQSLTWKTKEYTSIYFGGGTPSILPLADLAKLLSDLKNRFNISPAAEITLEANPDDINPEKLGAWLELGITRLSVGLQSFHASDLQWMNRAHGADEAAGVVSMIRSAGFNNFSIDLIYGLPTWSGAEWSENINHLISLDVPHVSCYILTVEPKTALGHQVKKGVVSMLDDKIPGQYALLCESLQQAGYDHYEVSNFAKPGFYSQHNGSYWWGQPYMGIGPGAHGFDGATRYWNAASNMAYIHAAGVKEEVEELTQHDKYNELIMTRLRTAEGLNLRDCQNLFGKVPADVDPLAWKKYLASGELVVLGDNVRIAETSWLIGDRIASDFFWV